jgi:hypothetical protein
VSSIWRSYCWADHSTSIGGDELVFAKATTPPAISRALVHASTAFPWTTYDGAGSYRFAGVSHAPRHQAPEVLRKLRVMLRKNLRRALHLSSCAGQHDHGYGIRRRAAAQLRRKFFVPQPQHCVGCDGRGGITVRDIRTRATGGGSRVTTWNATRLCPNTYHVTISSR